MTAPDQQLTFDQLCDQGARDYYEPERPLQPADFKGQGLTERERATITTIETAGEYL